MGEKVFLHGVPDTPAIWKPLFQELTLNSGGQAPALPGFGTDAPEGFDYTKEAYVEWVTALLEKAVSRSGPAHLIGHDWGALLTIRVASLRPDLIQTWTISNAAHDTRYKWHRTARIWQTPWLGELLNSSIRAPALARGLEDQGVPSGLAKEEASHFDKRMSRAILRLYRSAKRVQAEWDSEINTMTSRPGLVFWGLDDPYVPSWVGQAFAERTGATWHPLDGIGHWAIAQRPEVFAAALKNLWRSE